MALAIEMTISSDGNAPGFRLVKLFQVLFVNQLRRGDRGRAYLYTGIAFSGDHRTEFDKPAVTLRASCSDSSSIAWRNLTTEFAQQTTPMATYWGSKTTRLSTADRLRAELARGAALTEFDVSGVLAAEPPVMVLGDHGPGLDGSIVGIPAFVDASLGQVRLSPSTAVLGWREPALDAICYYAWVRTEFELKDSAVSLAGLQLEWTVKILSPTVCSDVSHYVVTNPNYRLAFNRCHCEDSFESNRSYGGGAKIINVQDRTAYFDEWLIRGVKSSAIVEVKDKPWFREHAASRIEFDFLFDDLILQQYLFGRAAAVSILVAALVAIGIDFTRLDAVADRWFGWLPTFASPTGAWFALSVAAVGGAYGLFSPASNLGSRLLGAVCLGAFAIFSGAAFLVDQEVDWEAAGWVGPLSWGCLALGALSWFATWTALARRAKAVARKLREIRLSRTPAG